MGYAGNTLTVLILATVRPNRYFINNLGCPRKEMEPDCEREELQRKLLN
ncbi:uncharacterized protein G2W53_018495 [Senna tora]|uniref:Uncharacterized protein n=1 Tax=Senna tora TaxID=362788 RepID=A0A834WPW7_9FABA|nr:uncharacterized protein G2W53_018495 [Senna tora]